MVLSYLSDRSEREAEESLETEVLSSLFSCSSTLHNESQLKGQQHMLYELSAVFRIRKFLGLSDPDSLVRGPDPDHSITKKVRKP
jgi:hypothetical protein